MKPCSNVLNHAQLFNLNFDTLTAQPNRGDPPNSNLYAFKLGTPPRFRNSVRPTTYGKPSKQGVVKHLPTPAPFISWEIRSNPPPNPSRRQRRTLTARPKEPPRSPRARCLMRFTKPVTASLTAPSTAPYSSSRSCPKAAISSAASRRAPSPPSRPGRKPTVKKAPAAKAKKTTKSRDARQQACQDARR